MGVGIYYFYHRFELKAFEGRHIRMPNEQFPAVSWQEQVIFIYYITLDTPLIKNMVAYNCH
jgi:hypothetical protein